jgi:hypothetical protein
MEFAYEMARHTNATQGQIQRLNAASIDRTDSAKGYVPGNVAIMSAKANRLKSDSTAEDMRKVLEYLERNRKS